MKLKNYLFAASLLIAATFTACKEPAVDELVPTVKIEQSGKAVAELTLPAEAATITIDVVANMGWEITDDADWLTVTPDKHTNDSGTEAKTAVSIELSANTAIGESRKANVTVKVGTISAPLVLTQEGAAAKTTLADVKAATQEAEFTVEGLTVAGVNKRSALLTDGKDYMLAYMGDGLTYADKSEVKVGDKLTVKGTTSQYGGFRQFGSSVVLTKTGTDTAFKQPEPVEVDGAALQAIVTTPVIKYVKYVGTLSISGNYYNVKVEGLTGAQGSLTYPSSELIPAELNGANVTVTGYLTGVIGTDAKFVNTLVTAIVKNEVEITYTETTIPNITAEGNYSVKGVTVVAMHKKGYLVVDGQMNAILVYLGAMPEVKIGDVVDLKGTVGSYNGNFQFTAGTTAEVKSSDATVDVKYEAIPAAQIEAYTAGYYPGSVEGVLTIVNSKYYNVTIEGTTKIGSISNPLDNIVDASLDGSKIKITGWSIGTSKSGETTYFNMMATAVEKVESADPDPDPDPTDAINLSKDGYSNCYIVSDKGTYSFETKLHDGTTVKTGDKAAYLWTEVEYTWEGGVITGAVDATNAEYIVKNIAYDKDKNTISFEATGNAGNAVIALCNEDNTIVWSWHIWATGAEESSMVVKGWQSNLLKANEESLDWLDRNIGATDSSRGTVASFGVYYQAGRKDPFIGTINMAGGSETTAFDDLTRPVCINELLSTGFIASTEGATIAQSAAAPMTMFTSATKVNGYQTWASSLEESTTAWDTTTATFTKKSNSPAEWLSGDGEGTTYKDGLVGGTTKTNYDPCPVGYRAPTAEELWLSFSLHTGGTAENVGTSEVTETDFSRTLTDKNNLTIDISAAGRRDPSGVVKTPGKASYLWTGTFMAEGGTARYTIGSGNIRPEIGSTAAAYPVRCVKE